MAMATAPISPRYCWRLPEVVRFDRDRGWHSAGFTTRLTGSVSFRDTVGGRRPQEWRPELKGELLVGWDEMLFLAATDSQRVDIQDIVHWEIKAGAPDYRGRALADTQQLVLHMRSGHPVALGWTGTFLGQVLADVLGRTGQYYDLTIAFVEGPDRRASLADRLPPFADWSLGGLSNEQVLDIEDFWAGESHESLEEFKAVKCACVTRPDLGSRLRLVESYLDGVSRQILRVDREMQHRRATDQAFVSAYEARQWEAANRISQLPGG